MEPRRLCAGCDLLCGRCGAFCGVDCCCGSDGGRGNCNTERGRSVSWCTDNTVDESPEDDRQKHCSQNELGVTCACVHVRVNRAHVRVCCFHVHPFHFCLCCVHLSSRFSPVPSLALRMGSNDQCDGNQCCSSFKMPVTAASGHTAMTNSASRSNSTAKADNSLLQNFCTLDNCSSPTSTSKKFDTAPIRRSSASPAAQTEPGCAASSCPAWSNQRRKASSWPSR